MRGRRIVLQSPSRAARPLLPDSPALLSPVFSQMIHSLCLPVHQLFQQSHGTGGGEREAGVRKAHLCSGTLLLRHRLAGGQPIRTPSARALPRFRGCTILNRESLSQRWPRLEQTATKAERAAEKRSAEHLLGVGLLPGEELRGNCVSHLLSDCQPASQSSCSV